MVRRFQVVPFGSTIHNRETMMEVVVVVVVDLEDVVADSGDAVVGLEGVAVDSEDAVVDSEDAMVGLATVVGEAEAGYVFTIITMVPDTNDAFLGPRR